MANSKRELIPVDQLLERLRKNETIPEITRHLRRTTGYSFSSNLVRVVAKENGWTFTGHGGSPRKEIPDLAELARRHREDGETLAELADEAGVSKTTLAKRMEEAGLYSSRRRPPRQDMPYDTIADHKGRLRLKSVAPKEPYRVIPLANGVVMLQPQVPERR